MLARLLNKEFTWFMGIEFNEHPPKKVGDISLDNEVDRTFKAVGAYGSYGIDPIYVEIGEKDSYLVFADILNHASPTDSIDFDTMKAMLYEASQDLDPYLMTSYRRGVDLYIDRMIKLGEVNEAAQ